MLVRCLMLTLCAILTVGVTVPQIYVPPHITMEEVISASTFEIPWWLGGYTATTTVASNWTLPLTYSNGGRVLAGATLVIQNGGPEVITLLPTAPETIGSASSYTIGPGITAELLSNDDWIVTAVAGPSSVLAAGIGTYITDTNVVNTYMPNVKDYGALCNGVTDDTAAIQNAINANYGWALAFPSGNCIVTTLYITSSISLRGNSESTITQRNLVSGNMISINGTTVVISDLRFNGNYLGQIADSDNAILYSNVLSNASNPSLLKVIACEFLYPAKAAIQVNGLQVAPPTSRLIVSESNFYGGIIGNSLAYAPAYVYVYDGVDVLVESSIFDGGVNQSTSRSRAGVVVFSNNVTYPQNTSVSVIGNTFSNLVAPAPTPIGAVDFYAWGSNCIVANNRFINCGSTTVSPIRMKTSACGVIISGNTVEGALSNCLDVNANSLSAPPDAPPLQTDLVISGNVFKKCGNRGISISQSGGVGGSSVNIIITDNIIDMPMAESVYLGEVDNVLVSSNVINGGTLGVSLATSVPYPSTIVIKNNIVTNTTNYAFTGSATVGDVIIDGNIVNAPVGAALSITGANSLRFTNNVVQNPIVGGGAFAIVLRYGSCGSVTITNNVATPCTTCTGYATDLGGNTISVEEGNSWNGIRLQRSAIPVSGTFMAGDIVWNTVTTYNSPLGWICTTAGTPGTWQAFARNGLPITQATPTSAVLFDVNALPSFEVLLPPAASVNYFAVQGGSTVTGFVRGVAAGTDTNIGIAIDSKGSSPVYLRPGSVIHAYVDATGMRTDGYFQLGSLLAPSNTAVGAITTTKASPTLQAFGAVVANAASGLLSFTVSTAAVTCATAVVTNTNVVAASEVIMTIQSYTGTRYTNGVPVISRADTSGSSTGSFTLNLCNDHATNALSGNLFIAFWVLN